MNGLARLFLPSTAAAAIDAAEPAATLVPREKAFSQIDVDLRDRLRTSSV